MKITLSVIKADIGSTGENDSLFRVLTPREEVKA